jgi:energy-coupling factor transport system permease protein
MSSVSSAALRVLSFGYRDRGGVLQQTRATIAVGWCAALGLTIALYMNPFVSGGVLIATLILAARCRVMREVALAVLIGSPVALVMAMVNPIVTQDGITVLVAGLHLPLVGTFDITQEAVNYGLLLGLRSVAIFAVCALYVCTVDPDELLRVLRRFSVRSAITASLAVRFVPVLARDGMNLAVARECRPGEPPSTAAIVRGTFARSLDRASDSALALETRGYALARPLKLDKTARRFADWLTLCSATAVAGLAIAGVVFPIASFEGYPLTVISSDPGSIGFAALLALAAAVPALVKRRAVTQWQ